MSPAQSSIFENGSIYRLEKLLWEATEAKEGTTTTTVVADYNCCDVSATGFSPSVCSVAASQSVSPVSPHSPHSPCYPSQGLMGDIRPGLMPTDWLWDWHARPDILHADRKLEVKNKENKSGLSHWLEQHGFSKEVLSLLLLSNLISLVLGVGVGYTVLIRRSL